MAVYQVCTDSLTIFTAQPTVLLTRSVLNQLTGLWVPLSVCVCVCLLVWLFFPLLLCLPAITSSLAVQGQRRLSLLYFCYLLTSDYTECSPVGKDHGLQPTPANMCPVVSLDLLPYQPHMHTNWGSHEGSISTGLLKTSWTQSILSFLFRFHPHWSRSARVYTLITPFKQCFQHQTSTSRETNVVNTLSLLVRL